ncbi:hypothetical protein [Streptomyces pini]|uniref:Methylated-DNA-[protein]-cysteine S-methyltransferase DNA binding domain-containing protein n=1 Tax=Streptomyces pini TaxID=1520580 RepID=A0A1I4DFV5_9ACTN|nr:hypothetical protein [Streptomyces pini]SFK92508.1 hypothetical protein SAMN05192584_110102 [Streptomyces pini]
MNLEIALAQRWGRTESLARADRLTERAVQLWPGPIGGVKPAGEEWPGWSRLRAALVAIPSGTWTTYGDVAELIGFDDTEQRRELLRRLNKIDGIELPEGKPEPRPSFPLRVLAEHNGEICEVLDRFVHTAALDLARRD